ncbi:ligand-binding sensor domain-containing diguanylate cyclase [Inhella gelatinilytica]|uniref:diguanylate cyclase n=1 Tax=Inhella gelatinilytica TaxID=2795030 RepID=A0A931IX30_9BURK|nr:ligand-binding sensor domain-containing diguanylate cyclase [Inhella gelatinilytica]MBH9552238.1 diguanylate cyclase [Inhella gelatinilytica]
MNRDMLAWLAALWIGLAGGALPVAAAGLAEPRFEAVGDTGSISDGVVSALVVDRQGFLWIGSALGLVRFDGYEFKAISVPSTRGRRSVGTFVRSLMASRDGRLWVGTDNEELAVYDPVAETWHFLRGQESGRAFRGTIRALLEDAQGQIWAGTVGGGLYEVNPVDFRTTRWGVEQGLPDDRIQTLMLDKQGQVWAGTWGGLAVRKPGGARFESPDDDLALKGRYINALHQDPQGRLWVGTQRGEVLRRSAGAVEWLDRGDSGAGPVHVFQDMANDEMWLGRGNGVEIRRRSTGQALQLLRHSVHRPWGPAGSEVRAMTLDHSGVLWIGSYGGGLQRHTADTHAIWVRRAESREDSVLGVLDARSLVQLPSGEIWVGTNERGVAVLGPDLTVVAEIPRGQGGYPGGRVGGIAYDGRGQVWVAADDKVVQFDAASRRFQRVFALGKGRVRIMRGGADGSVWAGTQDGVYRRRPGQEAFERLRLGEGEVLKGDINALAESGDGQMWVGGEGGLFQWAPGERFLRKVVAEPGAELEDPTVLGLLVDSRQHLWIDTSAGLHRLVEWSGEKARFESYSQQQQGLNGQSFGANLLEDGRGRIWTHRGMFDPADHRVVELSAADGVDIGTGWFRSYVGLQDGRMLFGGSRGLMVLDPLRFAPWAYQPKVLATELWVDGVARPLSSLSPRLQLQPNHRSFQVEFSAIDFSLPGRNRYRYRMQGVDAEWLKADAGERRASYGGLSPGRYVLEIQGTNRNGQWSPHALTIEVEVLPAWWQTLWARLAMGLLAVLGITAIVHVRTVLLRRRQRVLEQSVKERTEALEAATRALEEAAMSDPLTGLRNRRFLMERLDDDLRLVLRQHEEALRQGRAAADADLCFFMIDIDHFKQVNDQHGHAAGDSVLVQMRERLQEVFRESDYLVRWGGEEFLVVARASDRHSAAELAERARRAVAERPFELPQGRTLLRTCSIGFACYPLLPLHPRTTGWTVVVDLADAALYQAKRGGRNRWVGVVDAGKWTVQALADLHPSGEGLPEGLSVVSGPSAATPG